MSRYKGIQFVLISPEELKIPGFIRYNVFENQGIPYTEVSSLEEAMPKLDVLYMTRIQRERFDDPWEYERLKDSYVLDTEKMKLAKGKMCVLHPLPRVNEISVKVDDDPRAAYFRQALNGKYMRMALILKLLDEAPGIPQKKPSTRPVWNTTVSAAIPSASPRPSRSCPAVPLHRQGRGHPQVRLLRAESLIFIPQKMQNAVVSAFCILFIPYISARRSG